MSEKRRMDRNEPVFRKTIPQGVYPFSRWREEGARARARGGEG